MLGADAPILGEEILWGHGALVTGALSLVNIGGSAAYIRRARYRIYFSKTGIPFRPPFDSKPKTLLPAETLIERGESKVIEIADDVDFGPLDSTGLRDIRQFATEGWVAYVMGEIWYRDEGGADHYMGFCRERLSNRRFTAVDDADYECED